MLQLKSSQLTHNCCILAFILYKTKPAELTTVLKENDYFHGFIVLQIYPDTYNKSLLFSKIWLSFDGSLFMRHAAYRTVGLNKLRAPKLNGEIIDKVFKLSAEERRRNGANFIQKPDNIQS